MSTESPSHRDPLFELSLAGFAAAIARRRRLLVIAVATVTVMTAATILLGGREYTVLSTLISTTGITVGGSGLAGLAQAAGLNLSSNPTTNPEYYTELMETEDLLRKVAETPIDSSKRSAKDSILAQRITNVEADREKLVRSAIAKLRIMVAPSISQKSSMVTLAVKTKDPQLSVRLSNEILAQLEQVNQRARTSQNSAEAAFIESSLGDARVEVAIAESELRSFLQKNRSFTDPAIELDRQRILRKVEVARGTYLSLAGAYDRARIERSRSTPTISVLEPPRDPLGPDPRGVVTKALFAAFATTLAMLALIFVHELLSALWPNSIPGASSAAGAMRRVAST